MGGSGKILGKIIWGTGIRENGFEKYWGQNIGGTDVREKIYWGEILEAEAFEKKIARKLVRRRRDFFFTVFLGQY